MGEVCLRRNDHMKSTCIIRKIDELGRIVLPMELRRILDIHERDSIEIFIEHGAIVLKKHENSCYFCGSTKGVTLFKGKSICTVCLKELKDLKKTDFI